MLRATAVLLVLAAGCTATPPGGEGVPDAAAGPDGGERDGPTAGGLLIHLVARPALPSVSTTVSVSECKLWLRDVRAIGDAAPGDDRTSLAEAQLDFRSDRNPGDIEFPLAPPGLYSELDARLGQNGGQGGNGYEIHGTVQIGPESFELEVDDEQAWGTISIDLGTLRVDGPTVTTIALDLSFLGAIDWASLPRDGDKIRLDSSSAAAAQFRAGVLGAFVLAHP